MFDTRRLRYRLEAALARAGFALFRSLGLDRASGLGGFFARSIGPWLPISRRAEARLRRAMPEIDAPSARRIITAMWDNLGRVAAEYPHIGGFRLYDRISRTEVIGTEYIDQLREDGIGGIFFSGHYGNWEILSLAAGQRGLPLTLVYRAANNPAVEAMIQEAREPVPGRHPRRLGRLSPA